MSTPHLFFDTETNGLPYRWEAPAHDTSNWPRVVQIGWILTDGEGKVLTEEERIIRCDDFRIPAEASKIHGVTEEISMEEGVRIGSVLEDFNGCLKEAGRVVGHNIPFDAKVLGAEYHRFALPSDLFEREHVCTMRSSTEYCALPGRKGPKWPKLTELHRKIFGEEFEGAHGALDDTRATKDCYWELVNRGVLKS
jgi:DNA polymerase-3 subunit epsilon